jgi:integrase
MLHVPAKYKRCGVKVKCLACHWQLPNRKCHATGKSISTCPHKDRYRFNLIACVPGNTGKRRTKILPADTTFETALSELSVFRQELEKTGYKPKAPKSELVANTLVDFAVQYLDALSAVNTPQHLTRKRSKEYVDQCRLSIERFILALKKKKYPMNTFRLDELTDDEVGIYHDYLHKNKLGGERTYNKHIGMLKAFVNWCIRVKDQKHVNNVFTHVELKTTHKDSAIITKQEFDKLLRVVSPKNKNNRDSVSNRVVYKPWLKDGFRLALETGVRREELVTMRWSDIIEVSPGISVIKLNNLKVNRIEHGTDAGKFKYIPLTKSLIALLNELGYADKKGSNSFILERPEGTNIRYMSNSLSRGFAHYIKQVSDRLLEFKSFRKTYITFITLALGDKAKIFSGHSDSNVLRNHYLNSAFLVGNMSTFSIF